MAWTDLERVKRYLALEPADTSDDAAITDSLLAAQVMAERARASSGYAPSVEAPDEGCAEGVTRWAALLFQARGTGEGFAGFVDTGSVIGTPYYEQRRTILMLLGVPRPTVDGTPSVVALDRTAVPAGRSIIEQMIDDHVTDRIT